MTLGFCLLQSFNIGKPSILTIYQLPNYLIIILVYASIGKILGTFFNICFILFYGLPPIGFWDLESECRSCIVYLGMVMPRCFG